LVVTGRITLRDMAIQLGDRNPLAHHVTNVVISAVDVDEVQTVSKGLAVNTDGTTGSVTYEDTIRRTAQGWRITRRRVIPRRKPLTPPSHSTHHTLHLVDLPNVRNCRVGRAHCCARPP
jgi:myo-inositol catabolism protein IolC